MKVAGFGFRQGATVESLAAAFLATGTKHITHLATAAPKAGAPGLTELAQRLGLPICAIAPEDLAQADTPTQSEASRNAHATGSVSEAAALLAAGPGARLISPRVTSPDRLATCAIAEGTTP